MPESVTVTLSDEFLETLRELIRGVLSDGLNRRETEEDGFLDVAGAADFLSSTPPAIRSLVKRHAIPYYKTPAGRLLFDRGELDAWARSG